jgi:hypothetical protein
MLRVRETRSNRDGRPLDEWASVRPREYEQLKDQHYVDQVCGQVYYVEANAHADLFRLEARRWTAINYEALCADPRGTAAEVRGFLHDHGLEVELRCSLPDSFSASQRLDMPDAISRRVESQVATLWGSADPWRNSPSTNAGGPFGSAAHRHL